MAKAVEKNKETEQIKKTFFKSFFITGKRQEKVYNQIKESAKGDFDFYLMSLFAGIVITLGIIIDSAAVVIGGMLIAPLVWPILGMALGIVRGRTMLMQSSLITILKATVIIIAIALIIGLIAPEVVIENKEFASRTSPTLMELLIGLAAGFIGAFIISYPKMGSAISGVVVAAAIVPPVATVGLSIARGDFSASAGAFLLFLSNLIAITFAATILFLISNFRATSEMAEEKRKTGFRWSLMFLIIMIIPLILTTQQTSKSVKQNRIVKDVVSSTFEGVSVSEVKVESKDGLAIINLTLSARENIQQDQVDAVKNVLSKRLKQSVVMKIRVIPVLDVGTDFYNLLNASSDTINTLDTVEAITVEPAEEDKNIIKCPVVVNDYKMTREYPLQIGCPICPKVINCGDGREFPGQRYNDELGECEDLFFAGGTPCFKEGPAPIPEEQN
jgi:uncharacterized hydrophobic protein (TIGR00271 family)